MKKLLIALSFLTVSCTAAAYEYKINVGNALHAPMAVFDGNLLVATIPYGHVKMLSFSNAGNSVHVMANGKDLCGKPGDPVSKLNFAAELARGKKQFAVAVVGEVEGNHAQWQCFID